MATQAAANRQYGPKAIALLEQGLSVEEVVKRITDEDPGRDTRQVAVIDAKGRSAVYTGKRVIDRNSDPRDLVHYGGYAGHVSGPNYSVQGNTLASVEVVKAMAAAYERGQGSLAERLMDALDAGQVPVGVHSPRSFQLRHQPANGVDLARADLEKRRSVGGQAGRQPLEQCADDLQPTLPAVER